MDPNNGLVWFIYSLMFSVQCSVFSVQCSVFSVCCCENFESCFSVCCCVFPFASSDADASVKSTDFGISVFCKPGLIVISYPCLFLTMIFFVTISEKPFLSK
ncbi:hypothetical protein YC2023_059690 [Brassica napus]|uniref:(rape) hypothetical protein n=1 Tax=Brassica napus TaxID=3708 RepID=A0A816L0A3_BRANA|nr:unnamed protein product [Brassica napus]